ncbi:Casparian strip membrane protein domain [Sesbania bispinosa]|nr:Casparian strip membrane protein domain [Sesbania bispinosa]
MSSASNSESLAQVMKLEELSEEKKEMMWWWSLLGVRIAALLFCLTAFAVLAANKQKVVVEEEFNWLGWDSTDNSKREEQSYSFRWDDYEQFTYCVAVNVIGFVYSALQIGDLVKFLITKKHTVNPKLRGYFNFAIDQALTYLLLSASSAAATTIRVYKSGWVIGGGHTFIEMANASVALSFLAFVAFALASLASGFTLAKF